MKKITLLVMAVLFAAFTFAQTRTELKPSDISKPASEYIAKNFTGYSIDKIFKCDDKGTITCEVTVVKGTDKQKLVFDKDGKFLKKQVVNALPKAPVKPPVKEEPKKK